MGIYYYLYHCSVFWGKLLFLLRDLGKKWVKWIKVTQSQYWCAGPSLELKLLCTTPFFLFGTNLSVEYKVWYARHRWHKYDDACKITRCCYVITSSSKDEGFCLPCFDLTSASTQKDCIEPSWVSWKPLMFSWLNSPTPESHYCHAYVPRPPRLHQTHPNGSWAFPFAMISSHCPIPLLKNKTVFSVCGSSVRVSQI